MPLSTLMIPVGSRVTTPDLVGLVLTVTRCYLMPAVSTPGYTRGAYAVVEMCDVHESYVCSQTDTLTVVD